MLIENVISLCFFIRLDPLPWSKPYLALQCVTLESYLTENPIISHHTDNCNRASSSLHFLLDTPLYMIPKSHPKSDNPWIEWRISFSLVEKEIYVNLPSVLRKVYLLCKMLSLEWKKKFEFHSYILKTAFLWKYEEWGEQDKVYSEDDIIDMIIEVFLYVSKCYEIKNIAMYFMPEMNLLEQYSKTKQAGLMNKFERKYRKITYSDFYQYIPEREIERANFNNRLVPMFEASLLKTLKRFTEKSSLVEIIRNFYNVPFRPLITEVRGHSSNSLKIMLKYHGSIDPSHQSLTFLYTEKILKNNGIICDEDGLDLQCELYVTFLFLLYVKIFDFCNYELVENTIFHIVYFLKVFGGKNILEKDLPIKYIKRYCESIIVTTNIIREEIRDIKAPSLAMEMTGEPYLTFLEQTFGENSQHYIEMLNLNKAIIGQSFINGSLDEDLYLLFLKDKRLSLQTFRYKQNKPPEAILRKGVYQYGDKNLSEKVEKLIEKTIFWQEKKLFKGFVEAINENFLKKFYARCLFEAIKEQELDASEDPFKEKGSYLFRYLLPHMCEMYNYGFTENKFMLPTPALYISFLSQSLVNIHEQNLGKTRRVPDKWGYTVKEGDNYIYRTYDERKHNTFLYNVQYIDV